MNDTGILSRLVKAKQEEIERYKQMLKYQTAESEERRDVLERMRERLSRAEGELIELQSILELVEKYANED